MISTVIEIYIAHEWNSEAPTLEQGCLVQGVVRREKGEKEYVDQVMKS